MHVPLLHIIKFKLLARFQMDHILHQVVCSLKLFFVLIYCISFLGYSSLSPHNLHLLFPPPHHHHHDDVPLARISLTLSRHFSLLFIASGRSSGLHPVSSHRCYMYVRADRPAFAWPYAGVHRSTSQMSSSLLLQQCPACLVV